MKKTLIFGAFLAAMAFVGTFAGSAITTAMTGESPVQIVMRWREEDTSGTSKPTPPTKKSEKGSQDEDQNAPSDRGENDITSNDAESEKVYKIGETWTVDGQWALTVTSVEETEYRNEYTNKSPEAVYVINYSYTNLGYVDESGIMDGLYFGMDDTIVDSGGIMGYSYPGDISSSPQETPDGATCNAQSCIGVDNAGNFKMIVIKYDGNGVKQSAKFEFDVSK